MYVVSDRWRGLIGRTWYGQDYPLPYTYEYVYSWRSKLPNEAALVEYIPKANALEGVQLPSMMRPGDWSERDKLLVKAGYSTRTWNEVKVLPISSLAFRDYQGEGRLIDRLRSRNLYQQNLIDTAMYNTASSATRRSTGDIGHDFHKVTVDYYVDPSYHYYKNIDNTVDLRTYLSWYPRVQRNSPDGATGTVEVTPSGPIVPPGSYAWDIGGWLGSNRRSLWPSHTNNQFAMNAAFSAMSPYKTGAKIGETIISLLRGEFPTILKNLRQMINHQQSVFKTMGSDYLNYQFGWQPLIREFEQAIAVLSSVDRMLFTESTRRSRTIPMVSAHVPDLGTGVPYGVTQLPYQSQFGTAPVSGQLFGPDARKVGFIANSDIRISGKFSPIARPSIGANFFAESAIGKLEELGLWYPSLGWDLLPFSWLVDWSIGLGSAIENATHYNSQTGLVNIDYAYATTFTKFQYSWEQRTRSIGNNFTSFSPTSVFHQESRNALMVHTSKRREPATPFGFGVKYQNLTEWQFSILVALGLAKGR